MDAKTVLATLSYAPDTGLFTYTVSRGRCSAGALAGSFDRDGYRVIKINDRAYKAHRLAWLVVHGAWPKDEIDHINGNRADNRLCNLREATRSTNMLNTRRGSKNRSGFLGVAFHSATGRFQANLRVNGRTQYLGLFDTAEKASLAYRTAKTSVLASMERAE